ncbi:hypothetical protein [Burkholderia cenocepacia]|uniref:hypothetical protein n=1 Tax=Burkholderia cenocepacia TaxID=95486 RepID=UPI002ABD44D8|nr:hypothetical protein [Burkholderia cenocepacia]
MDNITIEVRANSLATAIRQFRKWGLRIVHDAETASDNNRDRYEQLCRAAAAMLGIDATEENLRSYPVRLVVEALVGVEPANIGLTALHFMVSEPFTSNEEVLAKAAAASRPFLHTQVVHQDLKALEEYDASLFKMPAPAPFDRESIERIPLGQLARAHAAIKGSSTVHKFDPAAFDRGASPSSVFNPLALPLAAKEPKDREYLVDLLPRFAGVELNEKQRDMLRTVLETLPPGASMASLMLAIKQKEAEMLGITPQQYDALAPLFEALAGKGDKNQ